MVPKSPGVVRSTCSDNGDVSPEAAIPADRGKRTFQGEQVPSAARLFDQAPWHIPCVKNHESRRRTGGAREDFLE